MTAAEEAGFPAAAPERRLITRLGELVDGLGTTLDAFALVQRLCESATELLGGDGCGYVAREGEVLHVLTVHALPDGIAGARYPLADSAFEALVRAGQRSACVPGGRFTHLNDQLFGDGDPGQLAVALTRVGGEVSGALEVVLPASRVLTEDELEVLELLAGHAGVALQHAELYAEVLTERIRREAVIEAMADGLAVVGPEGDVRSWNRALVRMTGVEAAAALGAPPPFPLPEAGGPAETMQSPNGTWIEVQVEDVALSGERVVDVRDVTRRQELDAAQDLFLATASHELRTPLTVLRGFGETLVRHWDVLEEERRRELVATMLGRTEGMADLVEQILLGTRAGAAGPELQLRPFDLAAAVRASAGALAGSSLQHPVHVDAEGSVVVVGDPAVVDPVLTQLFENAVKYSPDGGLVRIAVRRDGDEAVLTVADRGRGIAPADLGRVFERFVRAGRADGGAEDSRPAPGGAGLGLWIVQQYVDAQSGRVRALPRDGGGLVVEVRLPAG